VSTVIAVPSASTKPSPAEHDAAVAVADLATGESNGLSPVDCRKQSSPRTSPATIRIVALALASEGATSRVYPSDICGFGTEGLVSWVSFV
jgi:hypothetical protein